MNLHIDKNNIELERYTSFELEKLYFSLNENDENKLIIKSELEKRNKQVNDKLEKDIEKISVQMYSENRGFSDCPKCGTQCWFDYPEIDYETECSNGHNLIIFSIS